MANFIPPTLKKFRGSIISGTIFVFLVAAVFTCIGIVIRHGFADILRHWRVLVSTILFVTAPLSFLLSLAFILLYSVAFSNEGIYSYSVLGTKCFLRWDDILQVRRFKLLNLTYLRIYSKADKNVLWLPLFQSQPAEFMREIGKFAPPGCPIRNHLRPINT